ncbi:MAG: deoxyribonuclease IV [Caldisericota bacterium]|nr:deoxyribonuclease IV [Caldisericota bacterium]
MILGAHVSIAGGVSNAPLRAKHIGCDTMQIFSKNQMRWHIPPLDKSEIEKFHSNIKATKIIPGTVHSSYLVNLAAPDDTTHQKSILDLSKELERAEILGIPYVVFHPGAHKGKGEKYALDKIINSIDKIFGLSKAKTTMLLLETTAGEGTNIGYKFEHLAYIMQHSGIPERIGICVDTCHIFAAGYDIRDKSAYNETINAIEEIIGLNRLKAIHLNDSERKLASRVDRHAEIGMGEIGLKAFEFFVNDERLKEILGILEVPGDESGYKKNLQILRSLIK